MFVGVCVCINTITITTYERRSPNNEKAAGTIRRPPGDPQKTARSPPKCFAPSSGAFRTTPRRLFPQSTGWIQEGYCFPPNAGGSRTTANMLSPQVLARSTAFVGLSGATFGTIFQQRTHQEECCFGSRTPIGGIHKDTANTLYKVMLQCNFVESRIKVLARILCKSCVGRAWTKMVYKYTHTCILHMYIYIYICTCTFTCTTYTTCTTYIYNCICI